MNFLTAFKKLQEKFGNVDASVLEDTAIQITLSDEDCGGTFYAAVKDHTLSVEPYDYKDNDAVLDVTRKALTAILDGKTDIEKAIESGDLSIKGNLEKVAQIKNALKIPPKKAPAKKSPAKKATKKTTAKKETAKTAKNTEETIIKKEIPAIESVKKEVKKVAPEKTTAAKKKDDKKLDKKTTKK